MVTPGCGSDDSGDRGDSGAADGSGASDGTRGDGVELGGEEGSPCGPEVGCEPGLFCDDGVCAACGTGTPAPGKLCFAPPALVAERGGTLHVARLPGGDAVLADNREVHVRLLLPDGAGLLREQWFGASEERLRGELIDLDGDGFDEFAYCSTHAIGLCHVLSFGADALLPFATVYGTRSEIDGVPPHADMPARLFSPDPQQERWRSWLVYPGPGSAVRGAPLPIDPTSPLLAGDLDGDGAFELAAPVDDRLDMLELEATGIGYEVVASAPIPSGAELVAVADLDDDGRDEVLLATPAQQLVIARLDSSRALVLDDPIQLAHQPTSLAIGDLDGDGRTDLATKDTGDAAQGELAEFRRILVLAQTAPGLFERRHVWYPGVVTSVAMLDVQGDGFLDLVVSGLDGIGVMLANP